MTDDRRSGDQSTASPPDPTVCRSDERAGVREWVGLAVLALPLLVLSLDMSVLYLASPHLVADLQPTAPQQLWILDAYGFFIAGFLVTMGGLGDRVGRRRLLLIGAATFAIASTAAAFAPNAEALILARSMMGIAGASLMPSTLALITNMFRNPSQRMLAIGIWMTTFSVGLATGSLVGGIMLSAFWWGSVFLIGVPVMVLLLMSGPLLLPEYRAPRSSRIDLVSVILSLAATLPLIYGIKHIAASGVNVDSVAGTVAGLVFGIVFVRRQRRIPDPLVDLALFRYRVFVAALVMLLVGLVAENGVFFLLPQFLQLVVGLNPWDAGLWLIPVALVTLVAALLTPLIARTVPPTALIAAGCVLSIAGFVVLTRLTPKSELFPTTAAVSIVILGLAPVTVIGTDLVVSSVPPARAGSAAALSETSSELGVALGVAAMGSVVTAVYRIKMESLDVPGLPPDAIDTVQESAYRALAVGATLPEPEAGRIIEMARAAFTSGFAAVGGIGAVMLAAVVTIAVATLRGVPPANRRSSGGTSDG